MHCLHASILDMDTSKLGFLHIKGVALSVSDLARANEFY
jgi:hypothetical protein